MSSSTVNDAVFDPRVHDPINGTDAYCDKKMQDIDDEFTGYKMYSDLATWEYVAWKNVKLEAIQDTRITAANVDEYHHVEVLQVKPGTDYQVGLGYTSRSPFSRQADTVAYIARKKANLQAKYGDDLPGDSRDLDRAWDAVSNKFQGIAGTSEGNLDEHWLIELRKLRPDLVEHNPRPRAPLMAIVPTSSGGSSSSTRKHRRDDSAECDESAESEQARGSSQPRTKRPRKSTSPATQEAMDSDTRRSSRLKGTPRPEADDEEADGGRSDSTTAKRKKAVNSGTRSSSRLKNTTQPQANDDVADGGQSNSTTVKPKNVKKQGAGSGSGSKGKKEAPQLAWMNKRFRVYSADPNKPSNWKVGMSLEYKKEYNYPLPHVADYSMKNYWQQMEASGQFEAGLVCDERYYEDDDNYPGKDGSRNHPKVQKSAKEDD